MMSLYVNAIPYALLIDNTLYSVIQLRLPISLRAQYDALMAKKKPVMPATHDEQVAAPVRIVFLAPPDIAAIVDAEADENSRTRTAEILRLLREALKARGKWPPKS